MGLRVLSGRLPFATDLTFDTKATAPLDTSATFSGVPLGAAHTTRLIVIRIGMWQTGGGPSSRQVGSVTLDGVAMTVIQPAGNAGTNAGDGSRLHTAIAYLAKPTGTTGTVVVTISGVQANVFYAIHPVALYHLRSHTPQATGVNNMAVGSFGTSLSISLSNPAAAIQVLSSAVPGGTTYGGTNYTAHSHAIAASRIMVCGHDALWPATSGVSRTLTAGANSFLNLAGATWR